jgi:hypothetical protein
MYWLIKTGILRGEIIPLDHDVQVCGPIYVEWVCIWWWIYGDKGCDMARVKTWWNPYLTLLLEGILLSFKL